MSVEQIPSDKNQTRRKANSATWRHLVKSFRASNLTQQEFADAHGVNPRTLRNWLSRFPIEATNEEHNEEPSMLHESPGGGSIALHQSLATRIEAVETSISYLYKDLASVKEQASTTAHELEGRIESLTDEIARAEHLRETITSQLGHWEHDLEGFLQKEAYDKLERHIDETALAAAHSAFEAGLDEENEFDNLAVEDMRDYVGQLAERVDSLRSDLNILSEALETDAASTKVVTSMISSLTSAIQKGKPLRDQELAVSLTGRQLANRLASRSFFLAPDVAGQILKHLRKRRVVVLEGVPGTGKSQLARLIAEMILPGSHQKFTQVSVYPEATVADSIGSLRMIGKRFAPSLGWLTQSVLEAIRADGDHWLILDEINRCDISALLAPALDALEPRRAGFIEHPRLFPEDKEQSGLIPVPGKFRIIGTMNPFDRDLIFDFTSALDRRVGIIRIPPPTGALENKMVRSLVIERWEESGLLSGWDPVEISRLEKAVGLLSDVVARVRDLSRREPMGFFEHCEIGTSVFLEMTETVCEELSENRGHSPRELVDLVFGEQALNNPATFGRKALATMRDEVLSTFDLERCVRKIDNFLAKT